MPETFPVKCLSCENVFDCPLELEDERELSPCPLCGFGMTMTCAADLQLPQPAEVTIEEQTPQRLRIRMPECLRGSEGRLFGFAMPIIAVVPLAVGVWGTAYEYMHGDFFEMGFALIAVACGLTVIVMSIASLFTSITLEVTDKCVAVESRLGRWMIRREYPVPGFRDVFMRSPKRRFALFRSTDCVACIKTQSKTIKLADARHPEPARYVTQLIRQQLIFMENDLW